MPKTEIKRDIIICKTYEKAFILSNWGFVVAISLRAKDLVETGNFADSMIECLVAGVAFADFVLALMLAKTKSGCYRKTTNMMVRRKWRQLPLT